MKFLLIYFLALTGAFQAPGVAPCVPSQRSDFKALTTSCNPPDQLVQQISLLTRYAGLGYNLLQGNPDGDPNLGGVDPGIKFTRYLVDHTYNQGKTDTYNGQTLNVPDQVEFQIAEACTTTTRSNAYSGQTSYKSELDLSFGSSAGYDGRLFSLAFSLSSEMTQVRERIEKQEKVLTQTSTICNYGTVRYKIDDALRGDPGYTLTTNFKNSIRDLPSSYSEDEYMDIFTAWGTHMMEEVVLGRRLMERYESDYTEVYQYMMSENSGAVSFDTGVGKIGNEISIDITAVDETVSEGNEIGEHSGTACIGTQDTPMPIYYVRMVPITELLVQPLWSGEWSEIQTKKAYLETALEQYPDYMGAQINCDPRLAIPALWPDGTYTLVQSSSGCPTGWSSGSFTHDLENGNNKNDAHYAMWNFLNIPFVDQDKLITVMYCTKTSAGSSGYSWPAGRYCIGRRGGTCPGGFLEGVIKWDDVDNWNSNKAVEPILDWKNLHNPDKQYCCRSDGSTAESIFLPPNEPFGMWRHGGICQKVTGMIEQEWRVIFDENNKGKDVSKCEGNHPDNDNCGGRDIYLWYCSYTPDVGATVWPYGQFSLIQGAGNNQGVCGYGLSTGYIRQDREDNAKPLPPYPYPSPYPYPNSLFSYLYIQQKTDYTTTHYCTKTESGNATTDGQWPPGKYCIARHGNSCPTGFSGGRIYWDDEDTSNKNKKYGSIPDTSSDDQNTLIYYCCRSDGNVNTEIDLPYFVPFGLYRYGGTCQQVRRMKVLQFMINFDDEDTSNGNYCYGSHPDDDGCDADDHKLWVCAYSPISV